MMPMYLQDPRAICALVFLVLIGLGTIIGLVTAIIQVIHGDIY